MSLERLLESPLVLRLGWTIVHSLWEVLAITLVLAVVLPVLRRRGSETAYAASCMALVLSLSVPMATFFILPSSSVNVRPVPANQSASTTPALVLDQSSNVSEPPTRQSSATAQLPVDRRSPTDTRTSAIDHVPAKEDQAKLRIERTNHFFRRVNLDIAAWIPWLALVWTTCVICLSSWNCCAWLAVQRLKSSATFAVPQSIAEAAVELARQLGLDRAVRLAQSTLVESPIVIGALKPVILLPAALVLELAPDQLESLLAHELAHVMRHDYLVNLIQTAIETLLFFHPGIWWISAQVRNERENCCDDLAVRVTPNRAVYVKALAAVAGVRVPMNVPAATGGQLIVRLQRILGIARPDSHHSARWLAGVVVLSLCGLSIAVFTLPTSNANAADPVDLNQRYPATLDFSSTPKGYDWTCGEKDVWRLTEFTLSIGDQFRVEVKSAQVVLGHHDSDVLWAAIFPDQPGEIVNADAGRGEHVTSIWLRFSPKRLGEIFPSPTVKGQGDAGVVDNAKRLAKHKMKSCWQSGGSPMVPKYGVVAIDMETREGPRRFFSLDTLKSSVEYIDAFKNQPLPVANEIDRETTLRVFDTVWNAFDREYAMFVIKPDVDWTKLKDEYRPRIAQVNDNRKLAELLAEMLAHLHDLHVHVQADGVDIPVYERDRPFNSNRSARPFVLGQITVTKHHLSWSTANDRIGYIAIDQLTDAELPKVFSETLINMQYTNGLIIDLRQNGGGSEPLGLAIAGSFLDQARVYAKVQYRNGPQHSDLGDAIDQTCRPAHPWHYTNPVIVLQGQRTMSSAESLVLMLAQCPQVTTMGDRTAGSSGNPRILDAGAGITVDLPRWNPLDSQGNSIDGVGITPEIVVATKPADFNDETDPVLTTALERLRIAEETEFEALKARPGARVVSVVPADNANEIEPVTEIRVRFDRPMDPQRFHLRWKSDSKRQAVFDSARSNAGFRMRGEVRYDATKNEFVFPVELTPGTAHHVEVVADDPTLPASTNRSFLSVGGISAAKFEWKFRTRGALATTTEIKFTNEAVRAAHIENAGRSEVLQKLIRRIRLRRTELKSLVERVYNRSEWSNQKWFEALAPEGSAKFWWQGKTQFRADADTYVSHFVLHVGSDGQQCWSRIANSFVVAPADSIETKNVLIADPFHSESDQTDEAVIKELQLEYRGEEQHGGQACHRFRSWVSNTLVEDPLIRSEFREWLFDEKTLLPILFEDFGSIPQRFEFSFDSIDTKLPVEEFRPPADWGLVPGKLEPMGKGYDHRFLNVIDASAGRMSIRWGKKGSAGTNSSGMN